MPVKPTMRGVLHQWGFVASLPLGLLLVLLAPDARHRWAVAIYWLGLSGLLGVSALYHRRTWAPVAHRRIRRLDHSMIFVLVAGTLTPFAVVVLHGPLATTLLAVVWGGAAAGVVIGLFWPDAPKLASAAIYVGLGWAGAVAAPQILERAGPAALALVAAGGVLYTLGALTYAFGRPDPWPLTFGFHEIFHTLTLAAAACHYAAVLMVIT
jgi:hemolysin III